MRTTYREQLDHPTFRRASDGGRMPDTGGWQGRHAGALITPRGPEAPIVGLLRAWADYADRHRARYESGIGDDGVLGPAWAGLGAHLRTFLDGETGRLDCGTLDGFLCDTLTAEGFDPAEL